MEEKRRERETHPLHKRRSGHSGLPCDNLLIRVRLGNLILNVAKLCSLILKKKEAATINIGGLKVLRGQIQR